jgi:hypothetical protein
MEKTEGIEENFEERRLMVRTEIMRRMKLCRLIAKRNPRYNFQALFHTKPIVTSFPIYFPCCES